MNTCYTYVIGWKDVDKYYYGVRFAEGCQPSDLWEKTQIKNPCSKELS